ncbi:MAG: leucyl/phenylalanyl-tRNA--protein transferase [Bacteroidota bacterium]
MLNPDLLLYAYRTGLFPMADPDEDDQIYWYAPDPRAVMPLDAFHVPHNTAKRVRQQAFDVVVDAAFEATIRACAAPARGRMTTWISEEIISAYCELHRLGHAHSVEVWQDGRLVGGLYGVALRGAFFGESMFHRVRDASKVALVHLVARLRRGGFTLLDTQLQTEHLARFGNTEISREEYERRLDQALRVDTARWDVSMTGWTADVRHGGFAAGS